MGVKINVGYCQKIGLPNYGSEGAHCNLELEMDSGLLNNTEVFQRRVQEVYAACRVAVETQLQCDVQTSRTPAKQEPRQSREPASHDPQSHSTRRNGATQTSTASSKQSKYAEQLAAQVKGFGIGRLDNLCVRMYQKSFASLSGIEASNLIDTLREAKAGRLDLTAV